jgi:hypothetical protein
MSHGLPPNPTHHPLPSNPSVSDRAGVRSPARQMDPPDRGSNDSSDPRNEFPRGFTRGGFAPIPHRHSDAPPPREARDHDRERDLEREREFERRERELPRRDLDPEPSMDRFIPPPRRERDDFERDRDRDRRGRGPPPLHWEEDYGEPRSHVLYVDLKLTEHRTFKTSTITIPIRRVFSTSPSIPYSSPSVPTPSPTIFSHAESPQQLS